MNRMTDKCAECRCRELRDELDEVRFKLRVFEIVVWFYLVAQFVGWCVK